MNPTRENQKDDAQNELAALENAAPVLKTGESAHRGVSTRAVTLGCLLIPCNAFWIVRLERVLFGPYPSTISLFANVVFVLFVLVGLNAVLKRLLPRFAFSQGELLTLYVMLAISTGLAGLDGVGILSQMMPHGAWFGETNHWTSFLNGFPKWLVVSDHDVLRGHYIGNSSFYQPSVLRAWIVPMLAWTGFITLLMFVANCLNILVRRQWADRERLTFPIIWLPLEMTDTGSATPFFRNRLMWAGFTIAALLSLWNGLAFLYPQIPPLPHGTIDMKPFLTSKPWSAIDWMPISFYPIAIGLGFLLPLDLLFSCWFFFLYWKLQVVFSNAMGWDTTPDFPFIKEQGFGSIIGLFCVYFWSGRKAYGAVWRSALGIWRKENGERNTGKGNGESGSSTTNGIIGTTGIDRASAASAPEALSDRAALIGIVVGMAGLLFFCLAAGVAWWVAAIFFAVYFATITVITRIRAELGPPVHDFHFMGPDSMLPRVLSTASLRQPDMAFFTFGYGLTRAHRSDTMPVGLEGLQMAHTRQLEARRMFGAIMLATVIGTLGAFWAFEHQAYQMGAAAKFNQGVGQAQEGFTRMSNWVGGSVDARPNGAATGAMGIGLLTTIVLFALRIRYYGFPFHPIGYAVSSSWAIHLVWMPLLIAWVLKGLTMRYGGLRLYRLFIPFFLGLALGDCVMGSGWSLLSLALNTRTYNFFGE